MIQSSLSYTPVCPGDTVIFTCSSTNGLLYWGLDSQGTGSTGYTTAIQHNYTILVLNFIYVLINKSGQNLTSTATVHNVTNSLRGTTIYYSVDAVIYDEMATIRRLVVTFCAVCSCLYTVLNDSSVNITWSPPSEYSICFIIT